MMHPPDFGVNVQNVDETPEKLMGTCRPGALGSPVQRAVPVYMRNAKKEINYSASPVDATQTEICLGYPITK